MRPKFFQCTLLSVLCFFNILSAYDCVHGRYRGFDQLAAGAVPFEVIGGLNNKTYQKNCSKFNHLLASHYSCQVTDSVILNPLPKLSDFYTQGKYGACYGAASLFLLEESYRRYAGVSQKYSLSDAMMLGNFQYYKEGGLEHSFLLRLASVGYLLPLEEEKVSHHEIVKKIKNDFYAFPDKKNWTPHRAKRFLQKMIMKDLNTIDVGLKRIPLPSFAIQTLNYHDEASLLKSLGRTLKQNKLIGVPLPDHFTLLYGLKKYKCTSRLWDEWIVTALLIDPNGKLLEVVFDDLQEVMLSEQHPITLKFASSQEESIKTEHVLDGKEAFFYAVGTGDVELAKLYLPKEREQLNSVALGGWTPLTLAVHLEFYDMVKFLLTFKEVDINKRSKSGSTALYSAVYQENPPLVKLLLSQGADPHLYHLANHEPPLNLAIRKKNEEIVNLLWKEIDSVVIKR